VDYVHAPRALNVVLTHAGDDAQAASQLSWTNVSAATNSGRQNDFSYLTSHGGDSACEPPPDGHYSPKHVLWLVMTNQSVVFRTFGTSQVTVFDFGLFSI
jgi:hypothetical protein